MATTEWSVTETAFVEMLAPLGYDAKQAKTLFKYFSQIEKITGELGVNDVIELLERRRI
jgi:hypothetical protein